MADADVSIGGGAVVLDDVGLGYNVKGNAKTHFDVLGTIEVNANGDIVISTKDTGAEVSKANVDVEAIFGLGREGNMSDSGVRIMKGYVVRGRFQRDESIDIRNSTLGGVGFAIDTEVERTIGYKIRALLELGQTETSKDSYLVVQARGEGSGYVCKSLNDYSSKAVCVNLGAALGGGYKQASLEGMVGVDYRQSLVTERRVFLNEVRVGTYASGVLYYDSSGFRSGGQAMLGVEVR